MTRRPCRYSPKTIMVLFKERHLDWNIIARDIKETSIRFDGKSMIMGRHIRMFMAWWTADGYCLVGAASEGERGAGYVRDTSVRMVALCFGVWGRNGDRRRNRRGRQPQATRPNEPGAGVVYVLERAGI